MDEWKKEYSEPIQEIIGTAPSWITRYGISVMLGLFLMVFSLGYMIRLPQTLSAPVVIHSEVDPTSNGPASMSGILEIPSQSIGRIVAGQQVIIKLRPFPYLEYGTIQGIVTDVPPVPRKTEDNELHYQVSVSLPDGLNDSGGQSTQLLPEMDGTAEIVTGEIRLIEYLINPISSNVKKQ